MRVDTHIHLYDPAMGDYDWPPPGTEYYRVISADEYADALGTDDCHAIVVGCSSEFTLNEKLCILTEEDPRLSCFIAQLDPDDPALSSYTHALARYPVYRGFRCSAETIYKQQQRIQDAWIPGTVIEVLGNYTVIDSLYDFMAEHPDIPFVIEHFGLYFFKGQPVPQKYTDFCRKLAGLSNVSIKASALFTLCHIPDKPRIASLYCNAWQTVLDAFGPSRCMYGSDWPVLGVPLRDSDAVAEEIVRGLCGEDGVKAVMGESAVRIYGIR